MTCKATEVHQAQHKAQIDNMNAATAKLKAEAAYLEAEIKAIEGVQKAMEAMKQTVVPEAVQWAEDVQKAIKDQELLKDSYFSDKEEAISAIEDMADTDGTISFGEDKDDKEEFVLETSLMDAKLEMREECYDMAFWHMLTWLGDNSDKLTWYEKKMFVDTFDSM